MKTWVKIIWVLSLVGCATTPIKTGFLDNYAGMTNQFNLDGVRIAPQLDLVSYESLILAPIDLKFAGYDLTEAEKEDIVRKLEENFRVELSRYFKNVTSDAAMVKAGKALKLEIAVTELRPTDVAKNLIVGFGAGNATGSIEGKFVDVETGQELIAFIDQKKGSPFTKKEFNAGTKFPNWSKLRYLYLFTEIWAENVSNIIKKQKQMRTAS